MSAKADRYGRAGITGFGRHMTSSRRDIRILAPEFIPGRRGACYRIKPATFISVGHLPETVLDTTQCAGGFMALSREWAREIWVRCMRTGRSRRGGFAAANPYTTFASSRPGFTPADPYCSPPRLLDCSPFC
jgi:hypothetical protein